MQIWKINSMETMVVIVFFFARAFSFLDSFVSLRRSRHAQLYYLFQGDPTRTRCVPMNANFVIHSSISRTIAADDASEEPLTLAKRCICSIDLRSAVAREREPLICSQARCFASSRLRLDGNNRVARPSIIFEPITLTFRLHSPTLRIISERIHF